MKCPTKEQIIEAAKASPEIKEALKSLFPDVFEESKYIDFSNVVFNTTHGCLVEGLQLLGIRSTGNYKHKGFYLNSKFNWEIKIDNAGVQVLVPTRKL